MIGMGCDSGAIATKVVVFKDDELFAYDTAPTEASPAAAVEKLVNKVLSDIGISLDDIEYCGSTGWGSKFVPFEHSEENLVRSISRGTYWVMPSARTVIDAGALSSTAVSLNDDGSHLEYRINDKCASGSGRFIEIIAEALELKLDEVGALSLSANERVNVTTQCAVFAESEVVAHVNAGVDAIDIMAGVCYSVGLGLSTIAKRLGLKDDCVMIGGVAKNAAVVKAFEENTGMQIKAAQVDHQIIGAIGAALCAKERMEE